MQHAKESAAARQSKPRSQKGNDIVTRWDAAIGALGVILLFGSTHLMSVLYMGGWF